MIAKAWDQIHVRSRESPRSADVGLGRVGVRLAMQTVALVLVMLIVLEGVVYLTTQQALIGSLETTLRQRSNPPSDILDDIYRFDHFPSEPPGSGSPSGGGPGTGSPPGPSPYLNPSDVSSIFVNTHLQLVHSRGGQGTIGVLGNTVLDRPSLQQAVLTQHAQCCVVRQFEGQSYLVYSRPLFVHGAIVGAVQSSISEHQYLDTMEALLETLLTVALLGLLGSGVVSLVLVQRALRPIRIAVQRQRDFVADAAHELRTPLAIQRTVAEVGLADPVVGNAEETVEQMLVENKHLTRLVDDLSLLARADSHAVSINTAPMNLSALVADTAAELEPLAEEHDMRLAADVDANIWVAGDIMRLRQLLLVLLDNALKYTPSGGRVSVRLHSLGSRAQLQVEDTGPGIDTADLPHVFDRFYRADKARTGEGSGLGLAIARWIVEVHGGHLQAGNSAPHGAVFTATIPIVRVPASVH